jgi:hypothetical protein
MVRNASEISTATSKRGGAGVSDTGITGLDFPQIDRQLQAMILAWLHILFDPLIREAT